MGYCGGGGMDDDIGVYTSLAVVSTLLRRWCLSPSVRPPSVVCVCVAVSWFFSIPLVRRWRPMRAWVWIGCLVTKQRGERVRCRCLACFRPFHLSHLFVGTGHTSCSSCMCVFLSGGMHSYHAFFPRCWQCAGGVRGGSYVFVCAGLLVCRVSLPFPSLCLLLFRRRRPSCLFMLLRFFRWRRFLAVLFSIPGCLFSRSGALGGGVFLPPCFCARSFVSHFFLPSSPFIPFCFSAASLIACM